MEFLKDVLGEELYGQVSEKLKGNKDIKLANLATGEYVGKDKFASSEAAKKAAEDQMKVLQETMKKFEGVDVEKLNSTIADWQQKYDADTKRIKLESAVKLAISEANGKNPQLIAKGIDLTKLSLDGENVIGLSEQIESLKKSDGYLFGIETGDPGFNPPPNTTTSKEKLKQQYDEAMKRGDIVSALALSTEIKKLK